MISLIFSKNLTILIETLMIEIDKIISVVLNQILHNITFQKIESSWRGIYFLTNQIYYPFKYLIKIKLLSLHHDEFAKDLIRAADFDQTQLYKKIYSEELDQPGGEPFGILISDFSFHHADTNELRILEEMSKISASAFTPFIATADARFFGIIGYSEFKPYFDLTETFKQQEYQVWHQMRLQPNSRFLALILPSILMRIPYPENKHGSHSYLFKERCNKIEDYLWGSPAYYYAAAIVNSYMQFHWFYEITTVSNEMQRHSFGIEPDTGLNKPLTQVHFTEKQQQKINELGFITLKEDRFCQKGFFYNHTSVHYTQGVAQVSDLLPYILAASRFAHYFKVMVRDKIGTFLTPKECESYLQNWVNQYCAANSELNPELRSKYPLKEAQITLNEHPTHSGRFFCTANLKPHYPIEDIRSSLVMTSVVKI